MEQLHKRLVQAKQLTSCSLFCLLPLRPTRRCLKETSTWRVPVRGGLSSWPCCPSPSGQVSTWAWLWRSSPTSPRTTTGKPCCQGGKITHQAPGMCLGSSPGVSGECFHGRSARGNELEDNFLFADAETLVFLHGDVWMKLNGSTVCQVFFRTGT